MCVAVCFIVPEIVTSEIPCDSQCDMGTCSFRQKIVRKGGENNRQSTGKNTAYLSSVTDSNGSVTDSNGFSGGEQT